MLKDTGYVGRYGCVLRRNEGVLGGYMGMLGNMGMCWGYRGVLRGMGVCWVK